MDVKTKIEAEVPENSPLGLCETYIHQIDFLYLFRMMILEILKNFKSNKKPIFTLFTNI